MDRTYFFFLALFIAAGLFAGNGGALRPWGCFEKGPWKFSHAFNFDVGTHVNSLGYGFAVMRSTPIGPGALHLSGHAAVKFYETCLGLPGRSSTGQGFLDCTWGWGGERGFPSRHHNLFPSTAHNVGFYYGGYLTTDGTSQATGGWSYTYVRDKGLFRFRYENDWYSFRFTDEFRTGAMRTEYFRLVSSHVVGGGAGFTIWTGRRGGTFGRDYSHGILYIYASYDGVRLEIGADSEKIRDFIQNNYHELTGVEIIPVLDRADRVYLQLSIFHPGTLY